VNLTGGLINKGTIVIGGNSAQLTDYDSNVTLSGGGTVILSDASSIIGGNGELSPLVNEDNTIQGQGYIEVDLINQGTVNANVAGGTLTITVNNTANLGTMEATGGGTLYFQPNVYPGRTINNTNGTISTDGSSSVILAETGVLGGNLTSAGSAEIHSIIRSSLDGATITSGSTFSLDDGYNTYLTGDLINNGTVVLGSYSGTNPPNLVYEIPTATLSGDGAVDAPISSGVGGTIMTNLGNTIPNLGAGTGMIVLNAPNAHPTATTQVATDVTGTSATLNGGVNPEGIATTAYFVYGTDPTLTTGTSTTASDAIGGGFSDVALTAPLTGLQPGTTYYEEVVATNADGTVDGPIVSFTTLAPATATTQPASNVTATAATLNGSVNPQGNETTVTFVYGTDPTLTTGTTTTAPQAIASVGTPVPVTAALTGLQSGTTYYDEVEATNAGGTTIGPILSFTTLGPSAVTQAATGVTGTTATLNGSVNPQGSATTVSFVYGTDPTLTTGTITTAAVPIGGGTSAVPVTAPLTGLQPGTTYYDEVEATNTSGTTIGTILNFTTQQAPTVTSNPSNLTVDASQTATFTAAASDGYPTPTTVLWQVNTGSGWTNLSNSAPYSGVTTDTLTITGVTSGLN